MDRVSIRAHVITVSDRSAAGEREDRSGPAAVGALRAAGHEVAHSLVPDGAEAVAAALRAALGTGARLVLTSGGTGVSPRDRTPEGTATVLDRELPGVAELLRAVGREQTMHAALGRGLVGVVDATEDRPGAIVANLPGSSSGVVEGVAALLPLVPHVLDQLDGGDH